MTRCNKLLFHILHDYNLIGLLHVYNFIIKFRELIISVIPLSFNRHLKILK